MRVTVVGGGFVGVTTAAVLAEAGHHVTLAESNPGRQKELAAATLPFSEPHLQDMLSVHLAGGHLVVLRSLLETGPADLVFICVGTPSAPDGSADLSHIEAAGTQVGRWLSANPQTKPVIAVKSTVPPGTTSSLFRTAVDAAAGKAPYALASNPEFLREGSAVADARAPDRIVIGTDDPRVTYCWQVVTVVFAGPFMAGYLAFLGTLDTPIARPFSSAWARRGLLVTAASGFLFLISVSAKVIDGVRPGTYSVWDASSGPYFTYVILPLPIPLLYGMVVTISAWRRAPDGTLRRPKARTYAAAFITRDAGITLVFGSAVAFGSLFPGHLTLAPTLVVLAFATLLTYGILKHQVFDLDLRLKISIRRGTVAGTFLAVFLVATTVSSELLTDQYGWAVGGVAAGLLLFALHPLQRIGSLVADAALPRVERTPAYEAFRKLQVYQAAVEDAYADGVLVDKERRLLDRLRDNLGIATADAGRVGADARRVA